jgi:hypothetical protein
MEQIKHFESNRKIYFTTEYGKFSWLKGNREINEAKVKKIMEDISEGINFLSYCPIIVNEKMEIIDGQHRYTVAKMLKLPVHYVIHEKAELEVVPKINSRSSKWTTKDFLNSYVSLKMDAYLKLQAFLDNHLRISLPIAIKLLHDGNFKGEGTVDKFRDGDFQFKHYNEIAELMLLIKDFEPFTSNPYSSRFIHVMLQLHENGKYDHEMMIRKLNESGKMIDQIESTKSIISNMEQIINHRMRERVLIV